MKTAECQGVSGGNNAEHWQEAEVCAMSQPGYAQYSDIQILSNIFLYEYFSDTVPIKLNFEKNILENHFN